MNDLGTSLLPGAPIVATAIPSDAAVMMATIPSGNFDTLLKLRTDGAVEPVVLREGIGPLPSVAKLEKSAANTDAPDASAQAEIAAMLSLAFPPPPIPIIALDASVEISVAEDFAREVGSSSPAPMTTAFPQKSEGPTVRSIRPGAATIVGDAASALAPVPFQPRSFPESMPPPSLADAAPKARTEPLPKKAEAPANDVASVLGIIPPVLPAPAVPATGAASPRAREAFPDIRTDAGMQFASPATDTPPATQPASVEAPEALTKQAAFAGQLPEVAPDFSAAPIAKPQPPEISPQIARVPETLSQPAVAEFPVTPSAISDATRFAGMIAAKPGRGMPAPTLHTISPAESAKSAAPVPRSSFPEGMAIEGTATLRNAPISAAEFDRESLANAHRENTDGSLNSAFTTADFPREIASQPTQVSSIGPISAADVTQAVAHVHRATEQLRVSGLEKVEMGVTLEGGHQLTIQLHMVNGEVTPIIRTESEPLRMALEQNWPLFSQRSGDGDLHITTPIFESPQTSSDMSDLNHQRDQRQRTFNEMANESFHTPFQRRSNPLNPRPNSANPAQTAGIHLYA